MLINFSVLVVWLAVYGRLEGQEDVVRFCCSVSGVWKINFHFIHCLNFDGNIIPEDGRIQDSSNSRASARQGTDY